jgi:hypothetical protein
MERAFEAQGAAAQQTAQQDRASDITNPVIAELLKIDAAHGWPSGSTEKAVLSGDEHLLEERLGVMTNAELYLLGAAMNNPRLFERGEVSIEHRDECPAPASAGECSDDAKNGLPADSHAEREQAPSQRDLPFATNGNETMPMSDAYSEFRNRMLRR